MKGLWLGGLLLLSAPSTAQNKPVDSGNEFYSECSLAAKRPYCLAYIRGAADAIDLNDIQRKIFCPPEGVTIGQMLDVSLAYIERHPEKRHYRTIVLVSFGLMDAFPCSKAAR